MIRTLIVDDETLVPTFVTEIARFKIINGLGLYNTLGAPIVIYVASDLMQLYIYRQFISTIPPSLDESALLDGCSYFGVFSRIIFPLLAPATATVVIIKAITKQAAHPDHLPDGLRQCPAGFVADPGGRHHRHHAAHHPHLCVLPAVHSGWHRRRCGERITAIFQKNSRFCTAVFLFQCAIIGPTSPTTV